MTEGAVDILLCLLLLATLAYLGLVHRRLVSFREERRQLEAFVAALELATERAETAIRRLKRTSERSPAAPAAGTNTRRAEGTAAYRRAAEATSGDEAAGGAAPDRGDDGARQPAVHERQAPGQRQALMDALKGLR